VSGPRFELRVERLAESGEGIARTDSGVILIPGALPGERVLGRVDRRSRLATDLEWVESSPRRVTPPCPVASRCGGCDWLHVPREVQQEARLEAVRRALPPPVRDLAIPYVEAPKALGYRTRARIAWRAQGGVVRLGHRARGSREVVDSDSCAVMDPVLEGALVSVREAVAALGGEGEVFLARGAGGLAVATLRADGPVDRAGFAAVERLFARGFAGVSLYPPGASAPAVHGDPRPVVDGADGLPLTLGAEGFAQANESLNVELARHVFDQARCDGRRVLELFAGAGNFTVLLARAARKVSAVELDPRAVRALQDNVAARGLSNVSARACEATDALTSGVREDVVVLDPPRQGALDACTRLGVDAPRRVVYVSCDPATFGRDAERLRVGMELESVTAFEMFPQTAHVELVGTFVRRAGRR
jgi:23S rRNA (uracil1939-C5)-methyltransferase